MVGDTSPEQIVVRWFGTSLMNERGQTAFLANCDALDDGPSLSHEPQDKVAMGWILAILRERSQPFRFLRHRFVCNRT